MRRALLETLDHLTLNHFNACYKITVDLLYAKGLTIKYRGYLHVLRSQYL